MHKHSPCADSFPRVVGTDATTEINWLVNGENCNNKTFFIEKLEENLKSVEESTKQSLTGSRVFQQQVDPKSCNQSQSPGRRCDSNSAHKKW